MQATLINTQAPAKQHHSAKSAASQDKHLFWQALIKILSGTLSKK